MTEGKVPHTVGVAYLDWRSQRWWRSLIFSLESSSFSHSHSCFCSHPLWALQWCSIPEPSMGWEEGCGHRQHKLRQSCGSIVALLSLVKDSWSSLGQAAGTPWGRGAGTSQKAWVDARLMHFPVSIPSEYPFPGNYCILSKPKHRITHLPSEVSRGPVKK